MTDARLGDALWAALERLPRGSGVVFRDYDLPPAARRARYLAVRAVARRRRLVLVVAGALPATGRVDGRHGRDPRRTPGLKTWPAHNVAEVISGCRAGANLIFISPVFATASHPGARALGRVRAMRLAALAPGRAIALGGMDKGRFAGLGQRFIGWAAIDGWRA
ncbi:MAG: thiamine phosphate synthase [Sphingomonas sp.]|nr:thiamine phosphate synthase [Sphingomonas sp.]